MGESANWVLSGQRYGYDSNDNLDAITDLVQSNRGITMSFDGLDRLDTASGSWGNGNFDYDTLGNITVKQLGSQNLSYVYHPTTKRLSTVTGGYNFSYDDRGNVINNGKRAFQFNRANRLVSSGTIGYQYDGHGRRVKKTGSSTGYSMYDLSGALLLTDGPNGQTRYIHLGKELIAKVGSAAALEDKPGYTGHVQDKDLSLTYMQQRYYDPVIGRFYSNDPVGFTASNPMMFNRYAYANNNPYKYIDPNGEASFLASRPINNPVVGIVANHNYVVSNANYVGDKGATIHSYGDNGKGIMGKVDSNTKGTSSTTQAADQAHWESLSSTTENLGDNITQIFADDATVDSVASSVVENKEYSYTGVNSNSAASAVADKAQGSKVELPSNMRSSPGHHNRDKVEFKDNK